MKYLLLIGSIILSCGAPDTNGGADLAVSTADMAVVSVGLGSPCTQDTDCADGNSPVCFKTRLANMNGLLQTPGGYCSSTCTSDDECGNSGVCIAVTSSASATGSYCFLKCSQQSDCRTGYGCFESRGGNCFPSGNLNCDPLAPNGDCTTSAGRPGGCLREAYGTGMTGTCFESCTPGVGTCAVSSGRKRQCLVYDDTRHKDPGSPMNDTFKGAICIFNYSSNGDGTECLTTSSGAPIDRIDACADGLECYVSGLGGDNLCHVLCIPDPDGGTPDGGSPGCPSGESCQDAFGLFSSSKPIGLCQ